MRFFSPFLVLACGLPLVLQADRSATAQIESVSLGIQGNAKLGYWIPATIQYRGKLPPNLMIRVSLPDTDGLRATFVDSQPLVRELGEVQLIETLVKLGRNRGQAEFELLDAADPDAPQRIEKKESSIRSICSPLDALVELYVSLGRSIEIQGAAVIGGTNEYAQAKGVAIESGDLVSRGGIGNHWKSLESVDGMIVEAGSFAESPMPYATQTALVSWVRNGGTLAITGGAGLQQFFETHSELASLFEGRVLGSRRLSSTSAIERTVKGAAEAVSGQRNRPLAAIVQDFSGDILVREGEMPIAIRQPAGFGHLILMTVNLAEEPLASWSDRKSLVAFLISQMHLQSSVRRDLDQRETRFGYEDFSGQLRSALDAFGSVAPVNFTVVAAIALLFILLIGPVDYFLLKKFARRMEWTWVTFSLVVMLACLLTFWIFQATKSSALLCRQVEIVDIDGRRELARGSLWTHVYSPASRKYQVRWQPGEVSSRPQQHASWFGFPGNALGGMDNQSITTSAAGEYQVWTQQATLEDLPINVAATKGLQMDWMGPAEVGKTGEPVIERNALVGRVFNPLKVELENVFVVHDRSIYQFRGKLGPGESFDLQSDSQQRNFSDYLNRRKVKDLGTEATPWRITDTNLRRILEIMMFYESAGGRGYVNLFQRYLHHVDFSHEANDSQAILVGRTPLPHSRIMIDGEALQDEYEESWTYYRILIPVQKRNN